MSEPLVIGVGVAVAAVLFGAAARPLARADQQIEEARVARRVIWQFFFSIALPVLGGLGLLIAPVFFVSDLDPRIWQALLAGLFIATGWLTTAIFNELAQRRAKAEKLRDYHKAIYAEIGNGLSALYDAGRGVVHGEETLDRMRRDPDFVPFVPREHHDHVFDALVDEIEVLPRQTIDAIVAYYSQVKSISALADDMRGVRFRSQSMSQHRRIALYQDYLEMRKQAFEFGQYALRLIKAYAEGGAPMADDVIRTVQAAFSSPDGGPSGRSRGSE